MDWQTYKEITDRPEVMSRWMLEQSAELVPKALAHRMLQHVRLAPVAKPLGYKGTRHVDMFELDLAAEDVRQILACVRAAVAAERTTSGTRDRGLGGFLPAWQALADALR